MSLSRVVLSQFGSVYISSWRRSSVPGSMGTWPTRQGTPTGFGNEPSPARPRSVVQVWSALSDFAKEETFSAPPIILSGHAVIPRACCTLPLFYPVA